MSLKQFKNYHITIELLEDLHSGTGQGNPTGADSIHIRGSNGQPILRATHIKGVFRDNAYMLAKVGYKDINEKRIEDIFGKEDSHDRGTLQLTSFRLAKTYNGTKSWISTKRKENSRVPEQDSLREIEYVNAGTVFEGNALIYEEEGKEIFPEILNKTMALGSSRTRGGGRVKISYEDKDENTGSAKNNSNTTKTLRVVLKNLEPLCLPTSTYNGKNSVESENFISGTRLQAAFAGWWTTRDENKGEPPILSSGVTSVSNAYYFTKTENNINGFNKVRIIPAPLSIQKTKAGGGDLDSEPLWSKSKDDGFTDKMLNNDNNSEMPKTKRLKSGEVIIINSDGKCEVTKPSMLVHLRHQTPDRYGIKNQNTEPKLYSEEEIAENQYFIADIRFSSEKEAEAFINNYKALFTENSESWLRVGRGGRPVKIVKHAFIDENELPNTNNTNKDKSFLVLTSDAIIRNDDLTFATDFNNEHAEKYFGNGIKIDETNSISGTVEIRGWNILTGRQKSPAIALKRGSVFPINQGNLNHTNPIGERTGEGFGQFIITNGFDIDKYKNAGISENETPQNLYEFYIEKADEIFNENKQAFLSVSKTQWQWLREKLRIGKEWDNGILTYLNQHSEKKAGESWNKENVLKKLKNSFNSLDDELKSNKEKILEYLTRLIIKEIVHKEEKNNEQIRNI